MYMTQLYRIFPAPLKIRYKGDFDWAGLYRLIWNWLLKKHFRVHEKRYKDKLDTAKGNELEVEVWGEKELTEYYKYKAFIEYHLWESKEVPVVVDGKQTKIMRGRIDIKINADLITDWQGRYKSDNMIHKLMEKFLNEVAFKYDITIKYTGPLDKDLHRLEAEIKKFLKMEAHASGVG